MKKKQWAQSFSLIDEKYVEEADPMRDAGRVSAVRRLRRRIITLAAFTNRPVVSSPRMVTLSCWSIFS